MINLPEISNLLNKKESSKINLSTSKDNKAYDYFSVRIPKNCIENTLKAIKDERFLFFIKYGILRRYEGDCDIIYIEIPQIPKKLVVYRRPHCRMKSLSKLNLSQRDLPHIPLFEGEDNLKYLSLELNRITKIDKLISLNNLIYLNLYGNFINEIENLLNVNKLRFLLLGKNNIEKIKNLNALTELEVLDLHSNKIKTIENIFFLKKLKVLNLANNQISSFVDLAYNKNLEELNIRKNLIEIIPNLDDFQMLKKINLGKNLIKKVDYLKELQKLKYLQEIVLEGNPVLNVTESLKYIKNLPLKGTITNLTNFYPKTPLTHNTMKSSDMLSSDNFKSLVANNNIKHSNQRKVNKSSNIYNRPVQSHSQSQSTTEKNKYDFLNNLKKKKETMNNTTYGHDYILAKESPSISLSNKNITNIATLTPISPNKALSNKSINTNKDNQSLKSFEIYNKILPIRQQWNFEISNIIKKGFNGYLHKKYKEINIDLGHVEVEDKNVLYLYGNCLKVLSQKNYQEEIKTLCFSFFCYDFIMSKKILEFIKNFKNLINIKFSHNNIYSFYQLIKLETLENLQKLTISDNEVCNAQILKYFIFYRLNNLKYFNNKAVKEIEVDMSRSIFQYFDEIISIKEKMELQQEKQSKEGEKADNIDNKSDNENKNVIISKEDLSDINQNENRIEFFDYAKFNLSVCIEEIIKDEEEKEDE